MSSAEDPVEWSREQWLDQEQPAPGQFTAMVAILRTYQAVTASVDVTLRLHGLTRTGYLLLSALEESADSALALGKLSRHLQVHPTTVTLALDRLEERRLLRREPHPTDRRTTLAVLTNAGRELLQQATESMAAIDYGLAGVDDNLSRRMVADLRAVRGL